MSDFLIVKNPIISEESVLAMGASDMFELYSSLRVSQLQIKNRHNTLAHKPGVDQPTYQPTIVHNGPLVSKHCLVPWSASHTEYDLCTLAIVGVNRLMKFTHSRNIGYLKYCNI